MPGSMPSSQFMVIPGSFRLGAQAPCLPLAHWPASPPRPGRTSSGRLPVTGHRLLDDDAGELVAGGNAQLAEGLAQMMRDGVRADVHASGDLVVVQPLGDEAGDGLLGIGQAHPARYGPVGGRVPVAPADAELAQPPSDAGLVAVGAHLVIPAECILEVADRLIP